MDAADYRATVMRHNQMESYGINVQHWLPSVIANESPGHPSPNVADGTLTTFFGGQQAIRHVRRRGVPWHIAPRPGQSRSAPQVPRVRNCLAPG